MAADEVQRIKDAYARRDSLDKGRLYSVFNTAALFTDQQREKAIIDTLKRCGLKDLSDKTILEVGCGNGRILRDFMKYGAKPQNCYGIDLLPDRIEAANALSPNMFFACGNAETLPYQDGHFDILIAFTLFTSIMDAGMKLKIAGEMLRVLKPGRIILWYDYHMNNPKNPDVNGIKKKEIVELFSGCQILLKRTTLAPPISRILARYSFLACCLLEKIRLLNTHYIGFIRKPG